MFNPTTSALPSITEIIGAEIPIPSLLTLKMITEFY